jgi:hypothetical protein
MGQGRGVAVQEPRLDGGLGRSCHAVRVPRQLFLELRSGGSLSESGSELEEESIGIGLA